MGAGSPVVGNVIVTYRTTAEQPPNTLIDNRPIGRINKTSAVFTFHATKAGSTFECKLDLGTFTSCASPKNYSGLADGPHTFQVRATAGGLTDPTPTTAKWTVDTTPPNTIILLRPVGNVISSSATFTFIATHSTPTGNTFECQLDLRGYVPCTSPRVFEGPPIRGGLTGGPHAFSVRATDTAGNTDPTPTIARWLVGSGPGPNTLVDLRPPHRTDETSASFTFHATENGTILTDATFECKLDSAEFAPCTAPKNYTGLADDSKHIFQVRATDSAGITDTTPTMAVWRIGFFCDSEAVCSPTTAR
jgi:hypothetical protein